MEKEFTIQEISARTGLTVYTLRYYEEIGLLDPVSRQSNGHRRYTTEHLASIEFLQCLRGSGMSIQQMCTFINLRRQGNISAPERLRLLEKHHQQVRAHIDELERHLVRIEEKMQVYTNALAAEAQDIASRYL